MSAHRRVLCLLALVAGCQHPIDVVTPHAEVADLVVRDSAGLVLARTVDNQRWEGALPAMPDGAQLRLVVNALDFRDVELALESRPDLQVRVEAEDPTLVSWEPQRGFGRISAIAPGVTRVRFLIWHTTHADFVSPWLAVTIAPPPARGSAPTRRPLEVP
jgi:hypothetical protein